MRCRGRPSHAARRTRRGARHWSAPELHALRSSWGESARTLRAAVRAVGDGRTWCAIVRKAQSLGLPSGTPQGYVSMREAARRTGYPCTTLKRILSAAGVAMQRHPCRALRRRHVEGGWWVVEWDCVLEAVESVLSTETVASAARARGIPVPTLRTWLLAAGVYTPAARGKPVRLPSTEIDQVVEARGYAPEGLSVRAIARRAGLDPKVISRRLARAEAEGARPGRGRRAYLNLAELAELVPELTQTPRRAA